MPVNITLSLPEHIAEHFTGTEAGEPGLERKLLELIATEGYRQQLFSRKEVGDILNLSRWKVDAFLKEMKAPAHYSLEDFEADMRTNEELLANRQVDK